MVSGGGGGVCLLVVVEEEGEGGGRREYLSGASFCRLPEKVRDRRVITEVEDGWGEEGGFTLPRS